jgi:hypothetical protein
VFPFVSIRGRRLQHDTLSTETNFMNMLDKVAAHQLSLSHSRKNIEAGRVPRLQKMCDSIIKQKFTPLGFPGAGQRQNSGWKK